MYLYITCLTGRGMQGSFFGKRAVHIQKKNLHIRIRSLYIRKRAQNIRKRALNIRNRAVHFCKRALCLHLFLARGDLQALLLKSHIATLCIVVTNTFNIVTNTFNQRFAASPCFDSERHSHILQRFDHVLRRVASLPLLDSRIRAVCCSVLQCVAVRCSVLQCVAVCCSVLQ